MEQAPVRVSSPHPLTSVEDLWYTAEYWQAMCDMLPHTTKQPDADELITRIQNTKELLKHIQSDKFREVYNRVITNISSKPSKSLSDANDLMYLLSTLHRFMVKTDQAPIRLFT